MPSSWISVSRSLKSVGFHIRHHEFGKKPKIIVYGLCSIVKRRLVIAHNPAIESWFLVGYVNNALSNMPEGLIITNGEKFKYINSKDTYITFLSKYKSCGYEEAIKSIKIPFFSIFSPVCVGCEAMLIAIERYVNRNQYESVV